MENIQLDVLTAWLPLLKVPYKVVEQEACPCTDMVHIELPSTEAAALIELGRKLEQNRHHKLKTAA